MRSQFWGCPNGQFLLGVQQEIQMGKGCSYKDLLGTTLQSNPVLGDPPRIPSSSPSVFLITYSSSLLCYLWLFIPLYSFEFPWLLWELRDSKGSRIWEGSGMSSPTNPA
jgi:hypothetical protein